MKDIKADTENEKKMIIAIQNKIGAYANGVIGNQTLSDIAVKLGADCFPLTLSLYGRPTIIAKNLIAWNPKTQLSPFKNSMLGSFTYPRATTPCSILISGNSTLCATSCHAHISKPETVIYKDANGIIGAKRCLSTKELPKGVKWAVGGMGLCDMFNPADEGFTGQYADVLRTTDHTVLGVKNGMVYGVFYANASAATIQEHVTKKMCFEHAILLDGGGLAAINGTEKFAQIGTNIRQGYAIQFV